MRREFTAEQLEDLEEDALCTETRPWRHGHIKTFVVSADGRHWRFEIKVHHEEGWQLDGDRVTATEVHQVERLVKVWEAVA